MIIDIDPKLLATVKGFLDEEEGRCLYETALAAARLGPCLEIGSYCGKSTVYLGIAARESNNTVYAVDHHVGSEEHQPGEMFHDPELYDAGMEQMDSFRAFRHTMKAAGLNDTVVPLVAPSGVVARDWQTPLGMVFIDGESYDYSLLL